LYRVQLTPHFSPLHTHNRLLVRTHLLSPTLKVREQAGDTDELRNDVTLSVIDKRTKVLTWRPSVRIWVVKCTMEGVVEPDLTRMDTNGQFPVTVSAATLTSWMGPPHDKDHEDHNDVMGQMMNLPFTLKVSCEWYGLFVSCPFICSPPSYTLHTPNCWTPPPPSFPARSYKGNSFMRVHEISDLP
jgi:hypothetical protein